MVSVKFVVSSTAIPKIPGGNCDNQQQSFIEEMEEAEEVREMQETDREQARKNKEDDVRHKEKQNRERWEADRVQYTMQLETPITPALDNQEKRVDNQEINNHVEQTRREKEPMLEQWRLKKEERLLKAREDQIRQDKEDRAETLKRIARNQVKKRERQQEQRNPWRREMNGNNEDTTIEKFTEIKTTADGVVDGKVPRPAKVKNTSVSGSCTMKLTVSSCLRLLVTLSWFISVAHSSTVELPASEYLALYDLYQATDGASWLWGSSGAVWSFTAGANPCLDNWQGITCTNSSNVSHVSALLLPSYNLNGYIPNSVGNLTQLTYLSFDDNKLSGSIPTTIGNLTMLNVLALLDNLLTGYFPKSVCNLGQLQYLDLSYNGLSGRIPECVNNLTQLWYLLLSDNVMSGSIPASVFDLYNVEFLGLRNNLFTGPIPSAIGSLTKLRQFDASFNHITGNIPASTCECIQLDYIELRYNALSGKIPECVSDLTQLWYLSLSTNQFSGTIPAQGSGLLNLQYLYLSNNLLTGPIPNVIGYLTKLLWLDVSFNHLKGHIPASICECTQLDYIDLRFNALSGKIPECVGALTQLWYLSLSNNQISGVIPFSIGRMHALSYIDMSNNVLTGSIPAGVGTLVNIYRLTLSNNKLVGPFLSYIGNLTSLSDLYLDKNHLTGTIPDSIGSLKKLENIVIGWNQLSGTIPSTFGNLSKLQILNLNNNNFDGSLPESFYTLRLFALRLNSNKLTGTLASSISNMYQLATLNMSYNYFEGSLPSSLALLKIMLFLSMDNNGFTGTIPANIDACTNLRALRLNSNLLSGTLPDITRLRYFRILSVKDNVLSGSLQNVFGVQQSTLTSVQLDGNQFTGKLPPALFQQSLVSLSIVGSCLHGTLPANICNATGLEALILYGLTTGSSCRSSGVRALSLSRRLSFGGPFNQCLLNLPRIKTLMLSSNGLGGTMNSNWRVGSNLTQLDLSHNHLSGSIPRSIQNRAWSLLDLSHNKLKGQLNEGLFQTTPGILYPSPPKLALSSNRLSGPLPSSIMPLLNISVLAGNLFECGYDMAGLPQHDKSIETYECSSNSFNLAIFFWLGFALIILLLILLVYRGQHRGSQFRFPLLQLSDDLTARLSDMHAVLEGYHVIYKSAWICTSMILGALMPCYIILSFFYSTHTNKYAFIISAIYTSGIVPFALSIALFLIVLAVLYFATLLRHLKCKMVYIKLNSTLIQRLYVAVVFAFTNTTIVLGANIAFVYVSLYGGANFLTLAQVALSLFKLGWGSVVSPMMIRRLEVHFIPGGKGGSFFALQLLVALFNNIAVPCLLVAALDPNCFNAILVPPSVKTVTYLLPTCVDETKLVSCHNVFDSTSSLQFTPPFAYSYQCSASFVTAYAPTFVYSSISTAVFIPILKFTLLWLYTHTEKSGTIHKIVSQLLPSLLKPLPTIVPQARDLRVRPLVGVVGILVNLLAQLGAVMTFGVVFPPIAFATSVSITALIYQTRYELQRFTTMVSCTNKLEYLDIINAECAEVGTSKQLLFAVKIIICYSCAFYTLFLFDCLGDEVGFNASAWVLIVVPLAPYVLFGSVRLFSMYVRNRSENAAGTPTSEVVAAKIVEMELTTTVSAIHEV